MGAPGPPAACRGRPCRKEARKCRQEADSTHRASGLQEDTGAEAGVFTGAFTAVSGLHSGLSKTVHRPLHGRVDRTVISSVGMARPHRRTGCAFVFAWLHEHTSGRGDEGGRVTPPVGTCDLGAGEQAGLRVRKRAAERIGTGAGVRAGPVAPSKNGGGFRLEQEAHRSRRPRLSRPLRRPTPRLCTPLCPARRGRGIPARGRPAPHARWMYRRGGCGASGRVYRRGGLGAGACLADCTECLEQAKRGGAQAQGSGGWRGGRWRVRRAGEVGRAG